MQEDLTRSAHLAMPHCRRTFRKRFATEIKSMLPLDALDPDKVDAMHTIINHSGVVPSLLTVAAVDPANSATSIANVQDNGWLAPLVDSLEYVLRTIQGGLDKYKIPYSYGWSIVALTAFVKLLTFPLTKQQVESSLSMQSLKPKIDAIKEKYGENKDAVQRETAALYEKAGVNPLAGCLPSLATIPIFIGLYRSLTSVAAQGDLDNQGFYWVPSLAGPTSIAAQKAGAGTAWLFPFVDNAPPIGWEGASRYLVLPVALVLAQYISSAIISPPIDPNSDNAKVQKAIYYALPLMVGWFSLNVPSGLSLYYFSNTVLTSAQQIFLRKLGGAKQAEFDLGPIELGKARRSGTVAVTAETRDAILSNGATGGVAPSLAYAAVPMDGDGDGTESDVGLVTAVESPIAPIAAISAPSINRRCKRTRRDIKVD